MESMQQECPPSYANHDPQSLVLPSVPTHDLPPPKTQNGSINLPDLKSLGLPTGRPAPLQLNGQQQWATAQQPSFGYQASAFGSASLPPPSPMETESVMSDGRRFRAPSIMSLDDPETREAAEALTGLRNMDFKRSSSTHSTATTLQPFSKDDYSIKSDEDDQEPLLSLITAQHPWIGGTMNGAINTSLYAYNSTMHYTPAFIQTLIERNVNAVAGGLGTVTRKTGVESRVRQYFGDTPERRTAREVARTGRKRTREASPESDDLEKGLSLSPTHSRQRSRTGSQTSYAETLPAYDENKAPAYEQQSQLAVQHPPQSWGAQLMITTSGLGVALSDASLRSLKYCLSLLRQATGHLTEVMSALRSLIVEYEQTVFGSTAESSDPQASSSRITLTEAQQAASQAIAERIKSLGNEIMTTLQTVTSAVSRYTGGALPENAGALVRRQLLSVPQRWRIAEQQADDASASSAARSSDAMRTGQRWLVFAEQGCDMIAQVGIVVSGTVESAEKWLESMGRRNSVASSSVTEQKSFSGLPSPRGFPNGYVNGNGNVDKVQLNKDMLNLQMTEKR